MEKNGVEVFVDMANRASYLDDQISKTEEDLSRPADWTKPSTLNQRLAAGILLLRAAEHAKHARDLLMGALKAMEDPITPPSMGRGKPGA